MTTKKPFFMQMALPEINEDWPKLAQVAQEWTLSEPKNSDAWYELGFAQENLHKPIEAKSAYQKALEFDSTNTDVLFRLGLMANSDGDIAAVDKIHLAIANINQELAKEFDALLSCDKAC
jgi:tetratricopeptide (TPR) repeat protein